MDKLLKYTLEVDSNSGTASLKSFEGSLGNVGKTAASVNDQMAQGLKETQSQMSQLASGAASLGVKFTAAMTAPVLAVAGLGISFNALQEQAQIAFTTMLSSGTKASAMLSDLKDFAAKTPFEFPDLVMASQRLMAMGIAAKDVKPTLTAIGDAAAGLGGGSAMIDVLTHALGQMSATGHVTGREIMEMSMSGVNALQMLADGFSVSTEKMQKMVSEGAVPAGQAIKILVAGMEQQFGGMMANQSQTFNGLVSTIKDESRFLAGELTDGLFNALKGPAQTAADSIHALRVEMGSWSDESKTAVLVTAGLAAGIGPLLLGIGLLAGSVSNLIAMYLLLAPTVTAVTTVMTFGIASAADFSAAITLLGEASLVAKLGLIGLAAGVGIAAGSFVNWLIEGTKVQTWLDSFTNGTLNVLHIKWGVTQDAQDSLTASTQKLSDKLGALGVVIPRGTDSIQAWNSRVVDAAKNSQAYQSTIADLAAEHARDAEATTAVVDILTKANAERQKATAAAEDQEKMTTELVAATFKETSSAPALIDALGQLEARHTAAALIVDVHGKKILDVVSALTAEGAAINPLLQKYADYILGLQMATEGQKLWDEAHKTSAASDMTIGAIMDTLHRGRMDALAAENSAAYFSIAAQEDEIKTAYMLGQAAEDSAIMQQRAGESVVDVMERQGEAASKVHDIYLILAGMTPPGVQVGPIDTSLKTITDHAKTASEEFSKSWATAMGNVTSGIAEGFAKAIIEGGNFKDSMIKLAKQAAEGMLSAFFVGLLTPLTNELAKIGASIASTVFGTGATAATGAAGAGAGTGGGAAAGGAGLLGISGATLAITGGIAAAVLGAVAWIKSQAHWEANTFVNNLQNPFGEALGNIANANASKLASGTQTAAGAQEALQGIADLWSAFKDAAAKFASGGSDETKVATQALNQLGPLVASIMTSISQNITDLTAAAANTAAAVTGVPEPVTGGATAATRTTQTASTVTSGAGGSAQIIDGYSVTPGADPSALHGFVLDDGSIVRAGDPLWNQMHSPFGSLANVIGSFQSGGPTKEGWGYLHDDEFVVPKDGALVGGGGGGDVIFQPGSIVIQAANGRDAAIELITTVERSADIRRRFLRLTANQ